MNARLLVLVFAGQEAATLAAMPALVAVGRAELASIRVACVRALPAPRVNRCGQIVADTDHEMARITRRLEDTFASARRRFDDVAIEVVVRFGASRHEALVETEAFEPTLIALLAARGLARLSTWRLRRRLARHPDAQLLVLEAERTWRGAPHAVHGRAWRDLRI